MNAATLWLFESLRHGLGVSFKVRQTVSMEDGVTPHVNTRLSRTLLSEFFIGNLVYSLHHSEFPRGYQGDEINAMLSVIRPISNPIDRMARV